MTKKRITVPELHPEPARPLTSREAARLIGSLLGGMAVATPLPVLRDAVNWWATADEAWIGLSAAGAVTEMAAEEALRSALEAEGDDEGNGGVH